MHPNQRRLNVLIYTEYFLPIIGGVQTAVKFLARGLSEWRPKDSEIGLGQVEVTLVTRSPADGNNDSTFPYRVVRQPGFFRLVRLLRHTDVVHIAGPCFLPLILGWLLRKPIVVEHHGYHAVCPNGMLFYEPTQSQCPGHFNAGHYAECVRCNSASQGRVASVLLMLLTFPRRWLCERVATNITISDHVATRIRLPRSYTVYYGIDPPKPDVASKSRGYSDILHIAYVGRLVAEKGLGILLRAAQLLNRDGFLFKLTLVGDGPERGRLESMVDSFGLRSSVNFTGNLSGQDLDDAVRELSVVVMPTLMEETAGLGVIEQMMRGGVVVVSDIGGLSEVVGETGWKFPAGDPEALYRCLKTIMEDRKYAKHIGWSAQQRALQCFTVEHTVREHLRVYEQIANQ
jgi:glycosyltransferase involved in cell wall biosynthesis